MIQISNQPLGTSGDLRRRLLFHHLPLALSSAAVFFLWMTIPIFQTAGHHGPPQGMQHEAHAGRHHGLQHMGGRHGDSPQAVGGSRMDPTGHEATNEGGVQNQAFIMRVTTATGYIALGLIALTLLIGPANLLLRRRLPVSNYLSRDVGDMGGHFQRCPHGRHCGAHEFQRGGMIPSIRHFFVAPDEVC
jgi:hypothetical protein